jgi:hypothetical protein
LNARAAQVPYALRLRSKKLHDDLRKIAKAERRSLNEIINMACEEYVARRKDSKDG